jgi:H+/Cl- antiporter ClcA
MGSWVAGRAGTYGGLARAAIAVSAATGLLAEPTYAEGQAETTTKRPITGSTPAAARTPETVERSSRVAPYSLVAAGLTAIVAGSVVWALDEDQVPDPNVKTYFNSAPQGISLVIAGTIATGVGVYLWTRVRSRERARGGARTEPVMVPTVVPSSSGATVGVSVVF